MSDERVDEDEMDDPDVFDLDVEGEDLDLEAAAQQALDAVERMESEGLIRLQDFRIINRVEDSYPFVHSTRLYPEWPLASCAITDPKLAKKVAKALFLLNYTHEAMTASKVYKWTYPANYAEVTECLRILGIL